jgi:hypothetical protein
VDVAEEPHPERTPAVITTESKTLTSFCLILVSSLNS